jgi:hypothetical protein
MFTSRLVGEIAVTAASPHRAGRVGKRTWALVKVTSDPLTRALPGGVSAIKPDDHAAPSGKGLPLLGMPAK